MRVCGHDLQFVSTGKIKTDRAVYYYYGVCIFWKYYEDNV